MSNMPIAFRRPAVGGALPLVLLPALLLAPRPASAQLDVAQCQGVLAKDLVEEAYTRRVQLAVLRLYSDQLWTEVSREQGSDASIFGIKVGSSASEFRQRWQSRYEEERTNYAAAEDFRHAHAVTSERAYSAYEACLHTLAQDVRPVRIAPVKVSPSAVQFRVIVRNPADVRHLRLKSEVTGATAAALWDGPRDWPTNGEDLFSLQWAAGAAEMQVTITDTRNRGNATITLFRAGGEAVLVLPNTTAVLRDTKVVTRNTRSNHDKEYDEDECDGAIDGWCMSRTVLSIQAAAGRYLELPERGALECLGFSDEITALRTHPSALVRRIVREAVSPPCGTHLRITAPSLSADRRTATATIENYSWGLKWQLTAREMEEVSSGDGPNVWGPGPVWVGKDFLVLVPAQTSTNETPLVIAIGNDRGFITLGASTATVGPYRVRRVNHSDGAAFRLRQYRLERAN